MAPRNKKDMSSEPWPESEPGSEEENDSQAQRNQRRPRVSANRRTKEIPTETEPTDKEAVATKKHRVPTALEASKLLRVFRGHKTAENPGRASNNDDYIDEDTELTNSIKVHGTQVAQEASSDSDDETKMRQKPYYSDEVFVKMTNLLYDPLSIELCKEADIADVAQLLGLTSITSSKEAFYWAHSVAREAFANRYRPGGTGGFHIDINGNKRRKWSIGKVEMIAFLVARRSMKIPVGSAFALGVGLAQEQTITKSEGTGEEASW